MENNFLNLTKEFKYLYCKVTYSPKIVNNHKKIQPLQIFHVYEQLYAGKILPLDKTRENKCLACVID